MMNLKRLLCLFLFLFPGSLFACSCANEGVINNFQRSEFVAKAKIIKITPDSSNSEYHDAEIEIINLYKGQSLNKIKIMSRLNTSCGFLPDENSIWIIFASRWQGMLSFGFCSGSTHLDRVINSAQYPNAVKNYGNTIKLKEGVLAFLKEHNLVNPNPGLLRPYNGELATFKGYKNKNRFAAFQVDVNTDLSVSGIKQLKRFQNRKLNKLVLNSIKKNLKLGGTPLAKPATLILFCYYYEKEGSYQSFLSFFDV